MKFAIQIIYIYMKPYHIQRFIVNVLNLIPWTIIRTPFFQSRVFFFLLCTLVTFNFVSDNVIQFFFLLWTWIFAFIRHISVTTKEFEKKLHLKRWSERKKNYRKKKSHLSFRLTITRVANHDLVFLKFLFSIHKDLYTNFRIY